MTSTGDSHSIPADAADPAGRGRRSLRLGSRQVLIGSIAVVVLGAGGWVLSRPHPGALLPGIGPISRDTPLPSVVGTPAPASAGNPYAFDVKRLFPPTRSIDQDGYKGRFAGAQQGTDCGDTLQTAGQTLLHGVVCQGYLAVDFASQDSKVTTSVTVLRFADSDVSGQVAKLMGARPDLVRFVQTDGTFADDGSASPSAAPGSPAASAPPATAVAPGTPAAGAGAAGAKGGAAPAKSVEVPRVEAVQHYVTVTSSRFADGHVPSGPQEQQDLDAATRAASYTVGIAFVWS
ncbi:hypothetical protein [Kitasatospora sp. LaBMicrA B282]|uniref:hypothetical protein n=1 Tax=Kitasatospora sp. LaBMicrA B282 TaxID=3420949 RepID=UPI003D0B8A82